MADAANYRLRLMLIRQKRIERRAGKALIVSELAMLGFIENNKVPAMMQHCILKVSKKVSGNNKEKFLSAFNICTACFAKHGYVRAGNLAITGKGIKRNRLHQREKEASSKKARYNSLINQLWSAAIRQMQNDAAHVPQPVTPVKKTNISARRAARAQRK